MRINYLSFDSISEGVGASQILNLAEAYRNLDQEINLVTFEKVKPNIALLNRLNSVGINWKPLTFGRNGLLGGISRIKALVRDIPEGDVVHARGDLPAFSGLLGSSLPLLWDIRSLWFEQRRLMNPNEFNKVVELVLRRINAYVSENCAAYTTLTDAILPELRNRHPSLPALHKTIPTCADLDKFQVSKFEKKEGIHLLLLGNFNQLYNTTWMHKCISQLQRLERMSVIWAHDLNLEDKDNPLSVFNQTSVSHLEVPDLIRKSDVGLLFLKDSKDFSLKAAMPTKIAEFWASGRPIIISKGVGDVDFLIEEYKIGLSINAFMDTQDILSKLHELLEDSETPNRCRYVAEKYFSIQTAAQSYLDLFQRIVK